jgi:hypothetical protein
MNPQALIELVATNPFATAALVVSAVIFLLMMRNRRYVLFSYLLIFVLVTMLSVTGRLVGVPGLSVPNLIVDLGLDAILGKTRCILPPTSTARLSCYTSRFRTPRSDVLWT